MWNNICLIISLITYFIPMLIVFVYVIYSIYYDYFKLKIPPNRYNLIISLFMPFIPVVNLHACEIACNEIYTNFLKKKGEQN